MGVGVGGRHALKDKQEMRGLQKGLYFRGRPFIMSDVDSGTGLKPISLSPKPEMK